MDKNHFFQIWTVVFSTLAVAVSMAGCLQAVETTNDTSLTEYQMQIYFKLDPRLTQSLYMGERWVSPPTYGPLVSSGNTYSVEARADVLDTNGQPLQVNFAWIPEDREMVAVSPNEGNQVTITIQRQGESSLVVTTTQGLSKTLNIQATYQNDVIQVQISQADEAG
ncbi:MAG TPA: hypothetical protein VJM10_06600 [Candidatus Methylomirabilis sp.]|nr:hypothetical protein [Candidatus Methylomirabilis sp.]